MMLKIDKIFCTKGTRWSSDILCMLRDEGWIQFKTNANTSARYVEFGNGSKIFATCAGESSRGLRSNIAITDEFMLVKKKDYDEIIEPTLRVRDFKGRPIDYNEETKQIFLSSARTKTNWGWTHLKNCVEQHYKSKSSKSTLLFIFNLYIYIIKIKAKIFFTISLLFRLVIRYMI